MPATRPTVLVIGGGIIGLAAAYRLARQGMAVTLIEAEDSPRGASWGNAGHIAIEQVEPLASPRSVRSAWRRLYPRGALALPLRDIGTWAPFVARLLAASRPARFRHGSATLKAMMARAMPAWRRLLHDAGLDGLLAEDGHFVVWETARTARDGRAAWLAANTGSARPRDATADEIAFLAGLTTAPVAGAIRFEGSGQIRDTGRLATGLLAAFEGLGGRRRIARVDRLCATGGRVSATIGAETLTADEIVVAAGAASGALLCGIGVEIPLIAERGYHLQTTGPRWPAETPPIVFEDRSVIVTRFADTLRIAGFVEFAAIDSPPDPGKWAKLHAHARALGLPIGDDAVPWMGARPTTPDYLPRIARSPAHANLIWATGHNHLGLTLAADTAETVAALAAGD